MYLALHLRVVRSRAKLAELEEVVRALDEPFPGDDLLAQTLGLAEDVLRGPLVGPEVGRARPLVEAVQLLLASG